MFKLKIKLNLNLSSLLSKLKQSIERKKHICIQLLLHLTDQI